MNHMTKILLPLLTFAIVTGAASAQSRRHQVGGPGDVQAERPDHEQNSRGDDGEVDAIHARQSRWLGHRSYVTSGVAGAPR